MMIKVPSASGSCPAAVCPTPPTADVVRQCSATCNAVLKLQKFNSTASALYSQLAILGQMVWMRSASDRRSRSTPAAAREGELHVAVDLQLRPAARPVFRESHSAESAADLTVRVQRHPPRRPPAARSVSR